MAATHAARQKRAKTEKAEAEARSAQAKASGAERSERQSARVERLAPVRAVGDAGTKIVVGGGQAAQRTVSAVPGSAAVIFFGLVALWIFNTPRNRQAIVAFWNTLTSGKTPSVPTIPVPAGTAAPSAQPIPGRLTPTAPSF